MARLFRRFQSVDFSPGDRLWAAGDRYIARIHASHQLHAEIAPAPPTRSASTRSSATSWLNTG